MEPDILDDLERKSQEILQSNKGLNELISRFNEELSRLRKEVAEKEGFEAVIKNEVPKLKKALEEKRAVIATMIDDMKPLEEDMIKKNSLIEELGNKLEDVSQDLIENEKKLQENSQQLKEMNDTLTSKRDETEILKKKLTEKTKIEEQNAELTKTIELHKREEMKLKNRIAAIESKTYEASEKNQKIMNELLRSKEKIQQLEDEVATKTTALNQTTENYEKELEELRKNEELKKTRIMQLHSKKITILNTQLASLKAHLEKQQRVVKSRTTQEKKIVEEFMQRLNGLAQTSSDMTDVSSLATEPMSTAESEEEESVVERPGFYDRITAKSVAFEGYQGPKIDEIMPMIEVAMQHGDDTEKIKKSLVNSGYKEEEINKAFSQLHII